LLIEYGNNEPIGTCRTEHVSPHLISAKLSEGEEQLRVICYLLDLNTIVIQDLNAGVIIATVTHDCKIDFLVLNPSATKLLFRDKKRQLHLYNLHSLEKSTLLNYCN